MDLRNSLRHSSMLVIPIFAVVVIGIIVAGYMYYGVQKDAITRDEQDKLSSIANLKVHQIASWRAERIADGVLFADNNFSASAVEQFLTNPTDMNHKNAILQWLGTLSDHLGYTSAHIYDTELIIRLSSSEDAASTGLRAQTFVMQAMTSGETFLTDLHIHDNEDGIHMSVVAPLFF